MLTITILNALIISDKGVYYSVKHYILSLEKDGLRNVVLIWLLIISIV
ncbi:hypothetical protein L291_2006 [Acinetobacter guillouiae MSP4-18]|nr:hypothetical protein L291_2006 [Acinetobacter guillouiae MSP4-18]